MEIKDIVTISLSSAAFCFSVTSFLLSFRQRSVEDRRSTRKALTDTIASISAVNLAMAQLSLDQPKSSDKRVVDLRRNYNSQKRFLANHGEYLTQQIPELVADIDCQILAGAFDSFHDMEKAEIFFKLAVEKSPNSSLRATNLRGLARFQFHIGNAPKGRKFYEESLQIELPDTDSMRRFRADTYLLWARMERDYGYLEEYSRIRGLSVSAAQRIAHAEMKRDFLDQIKADGHIEEEKPST